jgi:hypothetical protein
MHGELGPGELGPGEQQVSGRDAVLPSIGVLAETS